MNNEPVAYINKDDGLVCAKCYKPFTKELTDEEIQEIAHSFGAIGWMGDTTYEFARAILRKAQDATKL